MPLYEYQCEPCGHRFEVIQKFSDAPVSVCPRCGGAVEKLLSSPAIQFKGSGWYITDYARSGKSDSGSPAPAKGESASSGEGASTAASGETKSEAKAETKADAKTESKPSASTKSD